MENIIAIISLIFGLLILYNSLFKIKFKDYKDPEAAQRDASMDELGVIFLLIPWWAKKIFLILLGLFFIFYGFLSLYLF
ncbi:hypothetical protein ACO1D2_00030 [Bacillus thuringiensis]